MENFKKEEKKTYKNTPEEIRFKADLLASTINRLQDVFNGSHIYVEEALDLISLASHHAGLRLERDDIYVFIEGCDGRGIWEATIGEIEQSYFMGMTVRHIYCYQSDCTIVLHDYTEEEEKEDD